jgi:glycosyltransferase involved in cell wall biosynthesis
MRVLVYAEVNPNLIDGSSVWLASLLEMLGLSKKINITAVLNAPLARDVVLGHLKHHPRINFVSPDQLGSYLSWITGKLGGLIGLSHEQIAQAILKYDSIRKQDLIIIRGQKNLISLLGHAHIASRVWAYIANPNNSHVSEGYYKAAKLLVQTEQAKAKLVELLGQKIENRIMILPPIIKDINSTPKSAGNFNNPKLGYAGKFSPPYKILEMLEAFSHIKAKFPTAEFHIVGDKFHNAPYREGFESNVKDLLKSEPGIVWHGGVTRKKTAEIMSMVDVASSWRDASFDTNPELSTKILEYSGLGLPVLMNPTPLHQSLFGDDYPGYVKNQHQFIQRFSDLIESPEKYAQAVQRLYTTAKEFTLENTNQKIFPLLKEQSEQNNSTPPKRRKTTILFAGHDFKFAGHLISHFKSHPDYLVLIDKWKSHRRSNKLQAWSMLPRADLVFCEWCLGNAVWYSKRILPHQRLFIRLHNQEMNLPYLDRVDWRRVERLIAICPRNHQELKNRYPQFAARIEMIFNSVDCQELDIDKTKDSQFNLGMVGITPKLKQPHLALEILSRLRQKDDRYRLFIKGHHPLSYRWLKKRKDEVEYYRHFFDEIRSKNLEQAVVFDGHGDDMPKWYSKIGFILSTSEQEGSHHAIAEGMAAGCQPVIRNWSGADEIYPEEYTFTDIDTAISMIGSSREVLDKEPTRLKQAAKRQFDKSKIFSIYKKLFEDHCS